MSQQRDELTYEAPRASTPAAGVSAVAVAGHRAVKRCPGVVHARVGLVSGIVRMSTRGEQEQANQGPE